jgi:hypothetical protein
MLIECKSVEGLTLTAQADSVGAVKEVYFDDLTWVVRYLVVSIQTFVSGREILVPADVLGPIDLTTGSVNVTLSRVQIDGLPDATTALPVSRQYREQLFSAEGGGVANELVPTSGGRSPTAERETCVGPADASSHMRSAKTVRGYRLEALDRSVGHIEDFLIETSDWSVRFLEIDPRNWLPSRKVLVAPPHLRAIRWKQSEARLDLTHAEVMASPSVHAVKVVR